MEKLRSQPWGALYAPESLHSFHSIDSIAHSRKNSTELLAQKATGGSPLDGKHSNSTQTLLGISGTWTPSSSALLLGLVHDEHALPRMVQIEPRSRPFWAHHRSAFTCRPKAAEPCNVSFNMEFNTRFVLFAFSVCTCSVEINIFLLIIFRAGACDASFAPTFEHEWHLNRVNFNKMVVLILLGLLKAHEPHCIGERWWSAKWKCNRIKGAQAER